MDFGPRLLLCSVQPVQLYMEVRACYTPAHGHATLHSCPVLTILPVPHCRWVPLTWAWVWTPPLGHLEERSTQSQGQKAPDLVPALA